MFKNQDIRTRNGIGRAKQNMNDQNNRDKENSNACKDNDLLENGLEPSDRNIEIWEDLVNMKDLVRALTICIITTFSGYSLSPKDSYQPLLFGLAGAIVGFIISSFLIEPKREFIQEK
jgi:hypothetical protein